MCVCYGQLILFRLLRRGPDMAGRIPDLQCPCLLGWATRNVSPPFHECDIDHLVGTNHSQNHCLIPGPSLGNSKSVLVGK